MPKCLNCGNKGSIHDREKFMIHGIEQDRFSCKICGSTNLKFLFRERFPDNVIIFTLKVFSISCIIFITLIFIGIAINIIR
jgi:hypothetical protein